MAKPSIFSRDYERKMRKRRRRIFLIVFLVIILVGGIFIKMNMKNFDFSELKAKIQAWVDSDKIEEIPDEAVVDKEDKEDIEEKQEVKEEPQKIYQDLSFEDGTVKKIEIEEIDGVKKFVGFDETADMTGFQYDISPSRNLVVILDQNQNTYLFDINGTMTNITRGSYTSQGGDVFPKESILQSYVEYIWAQQPKFIDDTKIAYVSQLPYFGDAALMKYIWIYDLTSNIENCLWNNSGTDITMGVINPEKGLEVSIDGVVYYIAANGYVIQ